MAAVGTLGWAERTGGTLRGRDRLALHAQTVGVLLERLPSQLRRRLGLPRLAPLVADLARIRPPSTPAAGAASALCAEASSAALAGHAERTYLWARLLALRDGSRFDDELLYVGCALHDLGFTERFWGSPGECFSVDGAAAAHALAEAQGWPPARIAALEDAVILHLNVAVPRRRGVEAHLLQAGTALDVTGARLGLIARETAAAVIERHPRGPLKAELAEWFERETARRPQARLAFLDRAVALGDRTARAPFES